MMIVIIIIIIIIIIIMIVIMIMIMIIVIFRTFLESRFIVIIRGAAARAVHSTESRGDPRPVSAVNLDLWKRGAAACKWRRQVSRGQG